MLYGNRSSNQRESGTPYTRNAAQVQFERTMKREGRIVTTYTGGTEFRAFFRTRDEHENQRETIIMYYDVTAPVRPGTLVMIGYSIFLALNKETVENDTYYKSTLIRCNGTYTDNEDFEIGDIPFYTDGVKSNIAIGNNTLTMLNGNLEFLTEDNSLSRQIKINSTFNEFQRTFKVCNKYSIDGIAHIICEIHGDITPEIEYSIIIDGYPVSEIYPGDTFQLSATGYENGKIFPNATFEWTSNNTEVASIDGDGFVTVNKSGIVSFVATWAGKGISQCSDEISIGDIVGTTSIEIVYDGEPDVIVGGGYKKFSVVVTEANTSTPDISTIEWTMTILKEYEKYITYEVQEDKSILIKAAYNNKLAGETMLLTVTYGNAKDSVYVNLRGFL